IQPWCRISATTRQSHNELSSGRAISGSVALNANEEERDPQSFKRFSSTDPDGEAPDEEVATQRLQQDVSQWSVQLTDADSIHAGLIVCSLEAEVIGTCHTLKR
ncbi:hypothetical protein DPX16_14108, partial [Anabarilius grahami]